MRHPPHAMHPASHFIFDKLSAQSTFQELAEIVKSPNYLEMKVDKTSYHEIGSSAHSF